MNRLRTARLWLAVACTLAFVPLALATGPHVFDFVDALAVVVGLRVVLRYLPGIVQSLREPRWHRQHYLVLGIVVTWTATTVRHLWQWVWRWLDKPPTLMETPWLALVVWIAFLGGVLHLRGATEGETPRAEAVKIGLTVALGLALAAAVVLLLEPATPLETVVVP